MVLDRMNGYFFIQLISYLFQDYVTWHSFQIIETMTKTLLLPEAKLLKIRLKQLFDELFQYIGYVGRPNDDHITKLTRLYALRWACILGYEECKKMSALKLSKHFADNEIHKIPLFTYCASMMAANQTTWDKMLKLYLKNNLKQEKSGKQILESLSCAEDPDININYLNMAAWNTSLFSNIECSYIFEHILEKHMRNDIILDYVLKNFIIIKPILLTTPAIIKLILKNIYTNEQVDKIQTFIDTNVNLDSDTLSVIKKLIEQRKEYLKKAADYAKKRFYYTVKDIHLK